MGCVRTALPTCGMVILVTLAGQGPAHATGRSRAVIDLTETGDNGTVMARLRESFGTGFHAEPVPLDEFIDSGTGPWHIPPPGRLQPCSATPRSMEDLRAGLRDAEARIDGLEYDKALTLLDELRGALCACSDPMEPDVVHRIPYLRGIAEFYENDRDAARGSFRHAAFMVDKLEWDTAFSPEPQQVFLLGVGDAIQAPRASLRLAGNARPDGLRIDGREVDESVREVEIGDGRHVIQYRDGGGQLVGMELFIDGAGPVHLLGPEDLRLGLRAAPDDVSGAPAYATVAAAAAHHGYTEVVVLDDTAWDRCWWFNVIDGVWKPISLTAGARLRAATNHKTAGGVMAGTGGALIAGGTILAISRFAAMENLRPEMEANASSYAGHIEEYEGHRTHAAVGIGLLAGGGAALTTGLLLLARGKAIQEETAVDPRLTLFATPEGAWIGLAGSF